MKGGPRAEWGSGSAEADPPVEDGGSAGHEAGGAARARDPLALLLPLAGLVLFVFYYGARADAVGALLPSGVVYRVTGPPLPVPLHYAASAVLLGWIPLAAARRLTGRSLGDLGLGVGRPRPGLLWLALGVPLAALAGWVAAGSAAMQAVYPLRPDLTPGTGFLLHSAASLLYYAAWEVLFRGVLLLGLEERLGGSGANALQTVLSVLAHFGRPATETFAALPAGLVFGSIALRTRSVWYGFLIHATAAVSTDWFLVQP